MPLVYIDSLSGKYTYMNTYGSQVPTSSVRTSSPPTEERSLAVAYAREKQRQFATSAHGGLRASGTVTCVRGGLRASGTATCARGGLRASGTATCARGTCSLPLFLLAILLL